MEANPNNRLLRLSGSEYEIVKGEPDIRSWVVKDAQENQLGEVDDLLFDRESRQVRYIVLNEASVGKTDTQVRYVLVPIGLAELHERENVVILPSLSAAQLQSLPSYDKEALGEETETAIRSTLSPTSPDASPVGGALPDSQEGDRGDFYDHEHFNQDNLYRRRKSSGADNV